ncbi:MAG: Stf0 family sulfotransferase [Methylococcaceae bacterium]
MNNIQKLFNASTVDLARLKEIEAIKDPRSRYVLAITPRSGSSYLCDVMRHTKRLGIPQEVIDVGGIKLRLATMSGRTPEEYLRNVLRVQQSENGVSGTKASWFQWQQFQNSVSDKSIFKGLHYIYLTRRDLAEQAVSLYKATETTVFHTAKQHDESVMNKLKQLEYDYSKIKYWYEHITAQERGWQQYFYQHNIFPLCIYYEDLEADLLSVLKRIAIYVGVQPNNVFLPKKESVYHKIGDDRNAQWARQFALEQSGLQLKTVE